MTILATTLVDLSSLWKIVLASLICGSGLAIAFSFVLIGTTHAAKAQTNGNRLASYAVTSVSGAFCIAVVAFGLYTLIHKS